MPAPVESATRADASARGAAAAAVAYVAWGLVPLYWKRLAGIDPLELIAHRHVWSLVLVLGLVASQGTLGEVGRALRCAASLRLHLLSGALLTVNWLVYVWGVNSGQVIETSLGYFLVPLVNVAAGRLVLGEQLRRPQWIAIATAGAGVALMMFGLGHLPWIALTLAVTWSSYGLLRKRSPLGSLTGLTVETLLIAPLAVAFLLYRHQTGEGALGRVDPGQQALILSAGLVTALPLLLFAYGARRLRLSTLGILQYLGPTVQFALGFWVYREPLAPERGAGFVLIWVGLAAYTFDNLRAQRRALGLAA